MKRQFNGLSILTLTLMILVAVSSIATFQAATRIINQFGLSCLPCPLAIGLLFVSILSIVALGSSIDDYHGH